MHTEIIETMHFKFKRLLSSPRLSGYNALTHRGLETHTWLSLVEVTTYRMFVAQPSAESIVIYREMEPRDATSVKHEAKDNSYLSRLFLNVTCNLVAIWRWTQCVKNISVDV